MNAHLTKKWQILRPLGLLENYLAARHQLQFYTNVAVTATYYLPPHSINRSIKNDIYRACDMLIQHHPVLSVNIVNDRPNSPCFIRLPVIDVEQCVVFYARRKRASDGFSEDLDVEELLQTQHNTFFEHNNAPLWKLCILIDPSLGNTFTASFIYHHVIGDGSSGKAFHTTFAQALEQILQERPQKTFQPYDSKIGRRKRRFITPPSSPLLPNLEELMNLPLCASFLIKTFLKAKFCRNSPHLWVGTRKEICGPLLNRVQHLALSDTITKALRKACSANETSVTALLEILISRSIFRNIDRKYKLLNYQGSMSGRRWISDKSGVTEDSMGSWVLDYAQKYKRGGLEDRAFPWHEARKATRYIKKNLAQRDKNRSVGLLKLFSNFADDILLSCVGKPRQTSFEISNLGVFESQSSLVDIGRMVFSQSSNIAGSAITVNAITGGDESLVLAFTWQDGVVEAALVQSIVVDIKKEIYTIFG
ncbi:alcohol acetyltransferase [Talaromyces proteolyticus]|uniref:Alcohol acetyltransferase n=1 Tax=Talaromyces proteolyticus TaxID=1131652 RepID=A0AAD4L0I6_9EURO|nr:alcohol acetyltransferase [Talaromyces proteolyticus]KAH8701625.1 alcohol acetyltransferase [Talaromyces proteolyticus]